MKTVHWIALILVVVGALNWGLVGLFQFDLVAAVFGGQDSAMSRIVYTLVGLAGLIVLATSAVLTNGRTRTMTDGSYESRPAHAR